jgi:osmotically-inducible protein OsmY
MSPLEKSALDSEHSRKYPEPTPLTGLFNLLTDLNIIEPPKARVEIEELNSRMTTVEQEVADLENQFHDPIVLAPLVSTALSQQTQESPEEIASAIGPAMGKAIKEQIKLEQDAMVDALYPIIGSTIAKYLAETIETINQKIELAFSVEGVQRKIRAKLQGVSEAELILREAFPLTIQAIFLIHKTSGLVIAEVQPGANQPLESDMLAGMLTAIRSFANDCFAQTRRTSELNAIDYGDSQILLEVAGYCYLAVVVLGEPSRSLIQTIRQTLMQIVQQHGEPIQQYDGDPETIPVAISQLLQNLWQTFSAPKSGRRTGPPALFLLGLILLGSILIPLGVVQYFSQINRQIEAETLSALATTPELAIYSLTATAQNKTVTLAGRLPNSGLRQKAAQIAQAIAPDWSLTNNIVVVDLPPDPELTLAEIQRVTATLNQIEGITISSHYSDGRVVLNGRVERFESATLVTQALERIPGVRVVVSTLQVFPARVGIRLYFEVASAQIIPSDFTAKLPTVMEALAQNPDKNLTIIGYSNPMDDPRETEQLALERANEVKKALIQKGILPNRLQVNGTVDQPTGVGMDQPTWLRRCVDFEFTSSTNTDKITPSDEFTFPDQ